MLHYILQVAAFQLGFLIIYDVFLRKETFFNWNRVYLLATAILSIIIPFIKIESIKTIIPEKFVIRLPEVIIGKITETNAIPPDVANLAGITVQSEPVSFWYILLFSGMSIALLILAFKIIKLVILVSKHPKRWSNNLLIIKLINSTAAFSFFHYVFLGEHINPKDRSSILEHEIVHVKQKHTLDLLFFEVLRVVFWFNPLVYMYQNRIATLHEYIADAKAVKHQSKSEYYNNLLAQVFETQQFSFVNPFFKHSLIKKRILMLSKTKSKQIHILKYALLLPLVCTMLIYTSSYAQEKLEVIDETMQIEDSELSDKELRQKYYNQIVEMKKNGKSFMEINDFFMKDLGNYIETKTNYYKKVTYFQYIYNTSKESKVENNNLTQEDIESYESLNSKFNRTYDKYVAWKQTDEAKDIWENNSRNGVLRLLVNDLGNMTEDEKQKMKHKLDMMERDVYFNKLVVSSIVGGSKLVIDDYKSNSNITEEIKVEEIEESIEVPFAVVDQVPIMVTCQDLTTNEERKACMSKNIAIHVSENFNVDLAKELGLIGKQRISVIFKIDTQGEVIDVKARAPHPKLEVEARRVINLLPQFKPGKQKGIDVTVPYSLPILFQVNGDSNLSDEEVVEEIIEQETKGEDLVLTEIPYAIVDQTPVFSSCQDLSSEKERKSCTSDKVSSFVNKNFNTDLAKQLNIKGLQRVSVVFKIDKEGNVTDVRARAPHPKLEEEAKRVMKRLPQFIPGRHDGKLIIVPYSLPIVFQVH
ncbi:M56 family metallopeptidase [Psychroserpens ponticola]|uniref:M56 family metallopeptidase n=1 Tax=Psychroserpens ponticola TaxID=2932268 RepID=A0ABY7S096_9FLAO|nr:M56 family metallopeptidase [Psychroserpens ponticola]WCO01350.1 M56 family metallopeptidase [Psychroserpens ponticola]